MIKWLIIMEVIMDGNKYYSCIEILIKVNRSHKKMIDYGVSTKIGLHRTQHIILMRLARSAALSSQKELAEHLGITPAAISGALDKLEAGGYIERKIGADNRFNEIVITELGKSIVSETKELFSEIDKSLFLGFSDQELIEFKAFLERMNYNIQNIQEA